MKIPEHETAFSTKEMLNNYHKMWVWTVGSAPVGLSSSLTGFYLHPGLFLCLDPKHWHWQKSFQKVLDLTFSFVSGIAMVIFTVIFFPHCV